jgi:hypothetical protein
MSKLRSARQSVREFTKYVTGEHADEMSFKRYVLNELRCAHIRAKFYIREISEIGIWLKDGTIDSETALRLLVAADALDFLIQEPEPPPEPKNEAAEAAVEFFESQKEAVG